MKHAIEILNSNYDLYKDIVEPNDMDEHWVDQVWAERNWTQREFYLLRLDGKYVGMASYQNLGAFSYIGYLYVRAGYHRKGYGHAILKFLETRAMMEGILDMRLFCNPKSTWALAFYSSAGFTEVTRDKEEILAIDGGILEPYYEENVVLLKKILKIPDQVSSAN